MKGLSDVRAELVRLQSSELELLQELLDARKAIAPQKVVIDELIRTSTVPPIDRLPNELLAQIFLLLGHTLENLARVSRRWRAVIVDTPSIWSEIWLENYITSTLLKLHLERSRQAPLTIFLRVYDPELLDVVAAHAGPLARSLDPRRYPGIPGQHVPTWDCHPLSSSSYLWNGIVPNSYL
ncbi:hypothetical protein F5J12DRAFT_255389 [Pisolithus orientalis]|uniref:uncharacterized protein n=1 Tax=Pisolithus orientalis TaxID=936130 RepID=UPI002224D736|nr:uncharacterized protein F5J12DRAFT_255389 [Pisolithus orientalis]KAI6000322.1 hypothetical protein F5J12DRAFT_255389 [Pisolithus orientalis]